MPRSARPCADRGGAFAGKNGKTRGAAPRRPVKAERKTAFFPRDAGERSALQTENALGDFGCGGSSGKEAALRAAGDEKAGWDCVQPALATKKGTSCEVPVFSGGAGEN